MTLALDHVALRCGDLNAGANTFARETGLALGPGGKHPRMGTHNRLLFTGGDTYLELISIDPTAANPEEPRWFGLDDVLPDAAPTLSFWVLRVTDLDAALSIARDHGLDLGAPLALSRGTLNWRLAVRQDGNLPLGGCAPVLIEWPEGVHPTQTMAETGVTVSRLEVRHPDASSILAACTALGGLPDTVYVDNGGPEISVTLRKSSGQDVVIRSQGGIRQ